MTKLDYHGLLVAFLGSLVERSCGWGALTQTLPLNSASCGPSELHRCLGKVRALLSSGQAPVPAYRRNKVPEILAVAIDM